MSIPAVTSAVVIAALSALGVTAPVSSPDLRDLRWVRGTIIATGPDAITLKLRDREITLWRTPATEVVAPDPLGAVAIGATVEAHYTDRKDTRTAIVLIADASSGELSKRPNPSARGAMVRVKWGALALSSGGKTRKLSFEKRSRLVDRNGTLLATGKAAIEKLLHPDADLLVKYQNEGGVIVEGVDLGGSDNIVEIRLLR